MAWGADRDIPCQLLFFTRARTLGWQLYKVNGCWYTRWQSWVGLIPGGWLTQLPIKIQLPRTAAATSHPIPRRPPAPRPSVPLGHRPPETNFLPETGQIISELFVSWPMIHTTLFFNQTFKAMVCNLYAHWRQCDKKWNLEFGWNIVTFWKQSLLQSLYKCVVHQQYKGWDFPWISFWEMWWKSGLIATAKPLTDHFQNGFPTLGLS